MNCPTPVIPACDVDAPGWPDACDKAGADSVANVNGMPPLLLKELISALATLFWLPLRVPDAGVVKFKARLR